MVAQAESFEVPVPPIISLNTLTVANAGVTYDPAILAAVAPAPIVTVSPQAKRARSSFMAPPPPAQSLRRHLEARPTNWECQQSCRPCPAQTIHVKRRRGVITEKTTDPASGPMAGRR